MLHVGADRRIDASCHPRRDTAAGEHSEEEELDHGCSVEVAILDELAAGG